MSTCKHGVNSIKIDASSTRALLLRMASFSMILCVLVVLLVLSLSQAFAQSLDDREVSAYECTQVSLDDIDESLLTREEKIARLDGALSDSINSYMSCVSSVQAEMSGGGGGANGNGGGNSSTDGDGSANNDSAANGATNGTANDGATNDGQNALNEQGGQGNQNVSTDTSSTSQGAPQAGSMPAPASGNTGNTAKREVIAPRDNDSIICKLLYAEIQNADADTASGLEKQYRDYKCGS